MKEFGATIKERNFKINFYVATFSYYFILVVANIQGSASLSMKELRVASHVLENESVKMFCDFDLDKETLYSVKWYKDGNEFYRYVPKEEPEVTFFPTPGVNVNRKSTKSSILLDRVNQNSTGRYRCEVSAEAPAFHTVSQHADVTVVVLPQEGPTISGEKSKYQPGDRIRLNCTSAPSRPAAHLTWYINEVPVEKEEYLEGPERISSGANGLESARLSLNFKASTSHFRQGDIKLKCLATISTVYRNSNEKRVAGDDRIVKQPMETRAQSHMRNEASWNNGYGARTPLKSSTPMLLSISSIFALSRLLLLR